MRTAPLRLLLVAAPLLLPPLTAGAASMRCDGTIIERGTLKVDLLARCGQPSRVEQRYEERTVEADQGGQVREEQTELVTIDVWTYDFGPGSFVMTVLLELGRIVRIHEGGYGQAPAAPDPADLPVATCRPEAIRNGQTAENLVAACGPPALRETATQRRTTRVREGPGRRVASSRLVAKELWSYYFGPGARSRLLTVVDGVLGGGGW